MKIVYLILLAVLCTSCAHKGVKVIRPTRIESHESYVRPDKINPDAKETAQKKRRQRAIWNR